MDPSFRAAARARLVPQAPAAARHLRMGSEMAKGQRPWRMRRPEPSLAVLRPALWSALLSAVASVAIATPTYADPTLPNTVPDTGARPLPVGPIQLPGGNTITPPPAGPAAPAVNNPLAAQILAKETELATLGEQLLALRQDHTRALTALQDAERAAARRPRRAPGGPARRRVHRRRSFQTGRRAAAQRVRLGPA